MLKYKPCVVVILGPPLRGKDYFAEKIKSVSNFEIIELDKIRSMIDPSRRNGGLKKLLPEDQEFPIMAATYGYFCSKAWFLVSSGIPILLPATFSRREFKAPLKALCEYLAEVKIPIRVFYLKKLSKEELLKRIKRRKIEGGFSNITTLKQVEWAEKFFTKIDFLPLIEIDTEKQDCFDTILKEMNDLKIE